MAENFERAVIWDRQGHMFWSIGDETASVIVGRGDEPAGTVGRFLCDEYLSEWYHWVDAMDQGGVDPRHCHRRRCWRK